MFELFGFGLIKMTFDYFLAQSSQIEKSCIAKSTQKSYDSLIKSYTDSMMRIPEAPEPFPLTEEKVKGFIIWYKSTHQNTTFGYLKQFTVSFSHYLHVKNLPDFLKNESFQDFMKGLRHEMKGDSSPKAKFYISKDIMNSIIKSTETTDEINALVSVLYFGFLRISEATNLKHKDVGIDKTGRLMLNIPFSKTDQTGKSITIYIGKTEAPYSPYIWFLNFIEKNDTGDENQKIFKKAINTYRIKLTRIFASIGLETEKYSTHSFRKGAAHEASLSGVTDCKIKAMGRWLSSCYTRYTSTTMIEAADSISANI